MMCNCGCGRQVTYNRKMKKYNKFCKGHGHKKYQFNRDTFYKIVTEEDAYWLGYFYADGWVKNKGCFGFCISQKDGEHLELFKKYLQSTHPITINKEGYCWFEISDKDYTTFLEKTYGLKQNKSESITFPEIRHDLKKDFIRGMFDGDGWIGVTSKRNYPFFGIIGNESMIRDIQIVLIEECDLKFKKLSSDARHKAHWVKTVSYSGIKNCGKIFDYLYEDATIYLKRKFDIWKNIYQD